MRSMSLHKSSPIGALTMIAYLSAVFSRTIRSLVGDGFAEVVADDMGVVVLDDLAVVGADDLGVASVDHPGVVGCVSSELSLELLSSLSSEAISASLSWTEPSPNDFSTATFGYQFGIPTLQRTIFE